MQGLMKIAEWDTYDKLDLHHSGVSDDVARNNQPKPGKSWQKKQELIRAKDHANGNYRPKPGKKKGLKGKAKGLLNKLRGKG